MGNSLLRFPTRRMLGTHQGELPQRGGVRILWDQALFTYVIVDVVADTAILIMPMQLV